MSLTILDPETNEKYDCENEYEFKIKSFAKKQQFNFFEDEVIAFALSLKDELIDELDNTSSKSDKIRCEHIKWIEKYLDGIHDFLIQQKMDIPKVLENHKAFIYRSDKGKVGRPSGKRNELTTRKYIWIRDQYHILINNRRGHTLEERARLIRSELLKNKPEFWDNHIYALKTIMDIIKKQKWGD